MARAGARRRQGVSRYPKSGAIIRSERGERPDKIVATVLAQPHRRGERDPRAGFVCGRLWLGGMIDERQYRASEAFTRRAVRYMGHITGSLPRFPSIAAEMVSGSTGGGADLDAETIAKIRSDYAEIQDALADAGMLFEANTVLTRACILDREITGFEAMGAFRCALNVIANRLRL